MFCTGTSNVVPARITRVTSRGVRGGTGTPSTVVPLRLPRSVTTKRPS